MDNMEEMQEYEVLTFVDEDGTEKEYAIIAEFELEGRGYIAVAEMVGEDIAEDDELYRCNKVSNQYELEPIEDDDEFDRVAEAYEKLMDEE